MSTEITGDTPISELPDEVQDELLQVLDSIPVDKLCEVAKHLDIPYHLQFHPYNVIGEKDEAGHRCAQELLAFEEHIQSTSKEDQSRFLPTPELGAYLQELSGEQTLTVFCKAIHIIATCVCKDEGKSDDQVDGIYRELLSMFADGDEEIRVQI